MRFTEDKIREIVDSFPFEEYDRNRLVVDWNITPDETIYFFNDNAIIEITLETWDGYDWVETSSIKVALTGDLEEDLKYGITNLLNKANDENNS